MRHKKSKTAVYPVKQDGTTMMVTGQEYRKMNPDRALPTSILVSESQNIVQRIRWSISAHYREHRRNTIHRSKAKRTGRGEAPPKKT